MILIILEIVLTLMNLICHFNFFIIKLKIFHYYIMKSKNYFLVTNVKVQNGGVIPFRVAHLNPYLILGSPLYPKNINMVPVIASPSLHPSISNMKIQMKIFSDTSSFEFVTTFNIANKIFNEIDKYIIFSEKDLLDSEKKTRYKIVTPFKQRILYAYPSVLKDAINKLKNKYANFKEYKQNILTRANYLSPQFFRNFNLPITSSDSLVIPFDQALEKIKNELIKNIKKDIEDGKIKNINDLSSQEKLNKIKEIVDKISKETENNINFNKTITFDDLLNKIKIEIKKAFNKPEYSEYKDIDFLK